MSRTYTVKELAAAKAPPFPFKTITKDDALRGFYRMKESPGVYSQAADNASNRFFQRKRYKTKREGISTTPLQDWKKKTYRERLLRIIKSIYKVASFKTFSIRDSFIRSSIRFAGWNVAQFHPSNAAIVYDTFKPKHIVDFSSGWGDRCVAAMALDIDYTGIDANHTLKPHYQKMIQFYSKHSTSKVKMHFQRSETFDFSKIPKPYDMIMTSPPFFILEQYNKMPVYDQFNNWIRIFLNPVVSKAWKHMKRGGHMCLHIPHQIGKYDIYSEVVKMMGKPDTVIDISRHSIKRKYGGESRVLKLNEYVYCWRKK